MDKIISLRHLVIAAALALPFSATPVAAQAASGAALFAGQCAMCHADPNSGITEARIGPALDGVFGRRAGSQADYKRYSNALKSSGKTWTEASLAAYLAAPAAAVPGTTMALLGETTAAERSALIAYLKAAR